VSTWGGACGATTPRSASRYSKTDDAWKQCTLIREALRSKKLFLALSMRRQCEQQLNGHGSHRISALVMAHEWPTLAVVRACMQRGWPGAAVSGVYEARYATGILDTRLGRLDATRRQEASLLIKRLNDSAAGDKDLVMRRLGAIIAEADAYDPDPHAIEPVECRFELHRAVWSEAEELRHQGVLLELGRRIRCPVVAIHGDYDPHPAEGVREPLSRVVKDFRFILLEKCGHLPWTERQARDAFFRILQKELRGERAGV
jgi:pimeloyl-ACP methyl ester carboxylesterase